MSLQESSGVDEPVIQPKNPFVYQPPSELAVEVIMDIRDECKMLHDLILAKIPSCRERSLAITKLEEVSMWANKAIAFNL